MTGASGGPRTSPIVRYLSAVRRFKWLVLLLSLVGFGGGLLVSRLRPESFTVQADILIADEPGNAGAIQAGPAYQSEQWKELFGNYFIVEPVAISRRHYIIGPKRVGAPPLPNGPSGPDAALFNGFNIDADRLTTGLYDFKVSEDGTRWELVNTASSRKIAGVAGDSVGTTFGFKWIPRLERRWFGRTFTFEIVTPREAADDIKDRLNIAMAFRAARFMHITLRGQDGPETAATLNDLMAVFVQKAGEMKKSGLTTQAAILDTQLTGAQARLEGARGNLEKFKVKTITLPKEDLPVAPGLAQTTPGATQAYIEKRSKVELLRRDRRDLADALARAEAGDLAVDLFTAIPTVNASPALSGVIKELEANEAQLRNYRLTMTDSAVPIKQTLPKIAEIRNKLLPAYTRAVLRNLDDNIARLDTEIGNSGRELQGIPQRTIAESRYQLEIDVAANIYKVLTDRYEAARLVEASAQPDVSILTRAVAGSKPTNNRKVVIVGMGILMGLGAGLGLALLFDVTDKRVRYADQITGGLGLTILGVIPEIKRAKGETPSPEEAAQVIEAFRTVRLNLAHTVGDGSLVITISSPSPGDGKSLVSSNLALSFAEAGYNTLLIDGDTRRGELHRTFGVERRPGLLDYLTGEIKFAQLVHKTQHPQLQLITAGSRKRNAPELLGGAAMRELIKSMREKYEVVIVDSPPLGAGIDPFVLSTLTGNLMLVLRAGATERDLAEAKLQIVDQLPIRLIGAVLNDVRATMDGYKYYSYSYGYGAVDEGEDQGKPQLLAGEKEE
ncbi:MAG: polysaccharide biosynthesis tyrosine autokinase [Gemmatimonadota bacterium]